MTIKVKKKALKEFIRKALDEKWTGQEGSPIVVNEPPLDPEPVVINPSTETQVADTDLPVEDKDWIPGNRVQLGMALKQLAEFIPDSQIQWFWVRAKRLSEKAGENVSSAGTDIGDGQIV